MLVKTFSDLLDAREKKTSLSWDILSFSDLSGFLFLNCALKVCVQILLILNGQAFDNMSALLKL